MTIKKLIISSLTAIMALTAAIPANAASGEGHTVKEGESLYKIGTKYGVSVVDIKKANGRENHHINPGEQLTIPVTVTDAEKDVLARLVEAEAKGESYGGKVAVAAVVLNRVDSKEFPDTIKDVIYDGYQFSPVLNGTISQPASEESKQAVREAIAHHGLGSGSLYFFNPDKADNAFLNQREVTTIIGNHVFAR
ncbi:N-acetylmuramoyl-L-alanine amidase [Thalassobacillus cyri]|uniref:N-acetylmuramoyl-L-alanine amidase n=1 Tax=Thalassobacillus cyri TaxID=571932 RepID=A0A1H3X4Z9_9BACI|nr:cell wall hydrolase [Thalassobacillus cyri]SDZ94487.1 N-acetylmuramoyl-L-alanine amidase [Thalassobacillus cyri]